MKIWQRCLYVTTVILLLMFGGLMFHLIETPYEDNNKSKGVAVLTAFLANNTCLTQAEAVAFIKEVVDLYDEGVLVSPNISSATSWDFLTSVFFSATIMTTIGYGAISPTSTGGRVFFIFYAIISIAMFLFGLNEFGTVLCHRLMSLADKVSCCKDNPRKHRLLSQLTIHSIMMLLVVFIAAAVFTALEGWDYFVSIYFVIVSLSTVGFGDYVPGMAHSGAGRIFYHFFTFVWLVVGLTWFTAIITTLQEMALDSAVEATDSDHKEPIEKDNAVDKSLNKTDVEDLDRTQYTTEYSNTEKEGPASSPVGV